MKKLNETKGNVTIGELSEYVKVNVSRKAIVVNSKPQTPTVKTSPNLMQTWEQKQIAY